MILKSIGVLSCGKILGLLYALMGLLIGGIFSLFALVGSAFGSGMGNAEPLLGLLFGLGAILVLPIFYGLMGFLGGLIGAALYNLIAGMIGGLELDLQ